MTEARSLPDRNAVTHILRDVSNRIILPLFQNLEDGDISEKGPGDLVTRADTEAEHALQLALTNLLPGSTAIGEEMTEADVSILQRLNETAPVWVIDPIDGTHNFAHGKDCFVIIVALVMNGNTVAGWIHDPVRDETIWAAAGEGAWRAMEDDTWHPIHAANDPSPRPLNDMTGSLPHSWRKKLSARIKAGDAATPARIVRYRCVGREYMDLALGKIDFALYSNRLKPWDHAAGILIHHEAGGYTALRNQQTPYLLSNLPEQDALLISPDEKTWEMLHQLLQDR